MIELERGVEGLVFHRRDVVTGGQRVSELGEGLGAHDAGQQRGAGQGVVVQEGLLGRVEGGVHLQTAVQPVAVTSPRSG